MKKLLLTIFAVIVLLTLSACTTDTIHTHQEYEDWLNQLENTQNTNHSNLLSQIVLVNEQLNILQTQLTALQSEYDTHTHEEFNDLQSQIDELEKLLNVIINQSIHNYGYDEDGNYISFEELSQLLGEKYFTTNLESGQYYQQNDIFTLRYELTENLSREQVFALVVMLLNELEKYDLYTQTVDRISINVTVGTTEQISIGFDTSLFTLIDFNPKVLLDNAFNISCRFVTQTPDIELTNQHLADYINSGVYDVSVLN